MTTNGVNQHYYRGFSVTALCTKKAGLLWIVTWSLFKNVLLICDAKIPSTHRKSVFFTGIGFVFTAFSKQVFTFWASLSSPRLCLSLKMKIDRLLFKFYVSENESVCCQTCIFTLLCSLIKYGLKVPIEPQNALNGIHDMLSAWEHHVFPSVKSHQHSVLQLCCICIESQLRVLLPNSIHRSASFSFISLFFFFLWLCFLLVSLCVCVCKRSRVSERRGEEIWLLLDSFSSLGLWLCMDLKWMALWVDEMKVYIVLR